MTKSAGEFPSDKLTAYGVRGTHQRRVIAQLLFDAPGRHVDAKMLHAEAAEKKENLSLATVYNTLHEFEKAGLLRRVAVPSERAWFDTDTGAHRHFYVESENRVFDLPDGPEIVAPDGYRITHVDTVVHLQRIDSDLGTGHRTTGERHTGKSDAK